MTVSVDPVSSTNRNDLPSTSTGISTALPMSSKSMLASRLRGCHSEVGSDAKQEEVIQNKMKFATAWYKVSVKTLAEGHFIKYFPRNLLHLDDSEKRLLYLPQSATSAYQTSVCSEQAPPPTRATDLRIFPVAYRATKRTAARLLQPTPTPSTIHQSTTSAVEHPTNQTLG